MKAGELLTGQAARYRIVDRLGDSPGGFADTFQATVELIHDPDRWLVPANLGPGSKVVIKLPKTDPRFSDTDNDAFIQRVNSQINTDYRALKRLSGLSCVARIFDSGQTYLPLPHRREDVLASFLVEEFVEGATLAERDLEHGRLRGRALPCPIVLAEEFYEWASKLANNLVLIHRRLVLHGDIWYTNVMVRDADREAVYIDFGSAVFRDQFFRGPARPSPGHHPFVAPEVRTGRAHGRRSDIYALGGLLYCLATGEMDPPEPKTNKDELKAHIEDQLYRLNRQLVRESPPVTGLIARCMRGQKEERIPTADALLREVRVISLKLAAHLRDTNVSATLNRINDEARSLEKDADYFFAGIVHAAADELSTVIADMRRGVFEIGGSHEAIVSRLCEALSLLQSEDEFITFSIPALWAEENLGVQGRVLDMERLLVTHGVRIRHVFLMCEEDRARGNQAEEILRVRTPRTDPESGESRFTGPEVYFRKVTREERDAAVKDGWHEGFIVRRRRVTAMEFVYGDRDVLRTVRFLAGERPRERVYEKLRTEVDRCRPVEEWFK